MFLKNILSFCPKYLEKVVLNTSNTFVLYTKLLDFIKLIFFLKKSTFLKYVILTDIVCTDYNKIKNRFKLTYVLTSIKYNERIFVSTFLNENEYQKSIESLYNVSN